MPRSIIYKPKDNVWRSLKAGFLDNIVHDSQRLYRLSLHSLFVPKVAVFGRFHRNGKGVYSLDRNFYRFSEEKTELDDIQNRMSLGEFTVVREFNMPDDSLAKMLDQFRTYGLKNKEFLLAVANLGLLQKNFGSTIEQITKDCFYDDALEYG